MNKTELKQAPTITMNQFLSQYSDLNPKLIQKLSRLTHREINKVLQIINGYKFKRKSFDEVEYSDTLNGETLIVKDKDGNLGAYDNPQRIQRKEEEYDKYQRR